MTSVPPPTSSPNHPDHSLDCEFSLEPAFNAVAEAAIAAGWAPETVTAALIGLANARQAAEQSAAETDAAIKNARGRPQ
jgi:hypothetical protein